MMIELTWYHRVLLRNELADRIDLHAAALTEAMRITPGHDAELRFAADREKYALERCLRLASVIGAQDKPYPAYDLQDFDDHDSFDGDAMDVDLCAEITCDRLDTLTSEDHDHMFWELMAESFGIDTREDDA